MKTLYMIAFCIIANTMIAQNSITCKNGLVVRGKITEITSERITIQYDSTHKKSFSIADVTKYYDGKNTIRARSLKQTKTYDPYNASAGDELIKASQSFYIGMGISFAGISAALIGTSVYKDDPNDTQKILDWKANTRKTFQIVGYTVSAVGIIMQFTAFSHVGKAGRKLNAISGKDGLGISLKF